MLFSLPKMVYSAFRERGMLSFIRGATKVMVQYREWIVRYLIVAFVLFLGGYLRFCNLEYMEFKGDELFNFSKALKFVKDGVVPLTSAGGSTGVNEPPIFMYLLSLPLLLSTDPVFVVGYVACLNVAGILLCYLFVRRFFSEKAAVIAAAFYSVSPWQVLFSRKIWTQNLLTPFIFLFLYLTFIGIYNNRKKTLIAGCVVLGFVLQLHMSAAYFAVLGIILLITNWNKIDKRYLSIGLILFLSTFVPYVIFLFKTQFEVLSTASDVVSKDYSIAFLQLLKIPLMLVSTQGFEYAFGVDISRFEETTIRFLPIDVLLMIIVPAAAIYMSVFEKRFRVFFVAWPILGILFLYLTRVKIQFHYFHSFYPVFFVLIGAFGGWMLNRTKMVGRVMIYAVLIGLVSYQFMFSFQFVRFIEKNDCIMGDYGPPYGHRVRKIETIVDEKPLTKRAFYRIHRQSCRCRKCDVGVTAFIINQLKSNK